MQRFLELSGDDFPDTADRLGEPGGARRRPVTMARNAAHAGLHRDRLRGLRLPRPLRAAGARADRRRHRALAGARAARGAGARRRARRSSTSCPRAARSPPARPSMRDRVRELTRDGEVEILTYTPSVQVALTTRTGLGRVAWRAGQLRPVVQCVRVRREGPLTGADVELRRDHPSRSDRRPAVVALGCARCGSAVSALLILLSLVVPRGRPGRRHADRQDLYTDGPEGRYLMEGEWLFRLDPSDRGIKGRYYRAAQHGGLDDGDGPARVERRRPLGGVDERLGRLVSQGLRAAQRERGARLGGALRVGQLPRDASGSTAGRSARTPAPTCRSPCCSTGVSRRGTNRLVVRVDSRRGPDRPPARPHQPAHRPADRRLVELRRDPARGLPASASTRMRLRVGDRAPAAAAARRATRRS